MAALLLALLNPILLFSQTEGEANPAREAEAGFVLGEEAVSDNVRQGGAGIGAVIRMVVVLALVAAAIYAVVYFLRKAGKPQAEQNPHLRVLATTYLGNGRYLHAVSVGSQAWLVGAGEGGVTHIADIADKAEIDAMVQDAAAKAAEEKSGPSLRGIFNRFGQGRAGDAASRLKERRERFERF